MNCWVLCKAGNFMLEKANRRLFFVEVDTCTQYLRYSVLDFVLIISCFCSYVLAVVMLDMKWKKINC